MSVAPCGTKPSSSVMRRRSNAVPDVPADIVSVWWQSTIVPPRPCSRPAVAVTILNDDPGGYRPSTARFSRVSSVSPVECSRCHSSGVSAPGRTRAGRPPPAPHPCRRSARRRRPCLRVARPAVAHLSGVCAARQRPPAGAQVDGQRHVPVFPPRSARAGPSAAHSGGNTAAGRRRSESRAGSHCGPGPGRRPPRPPAGARRRGRRGRPARRPSGVSRPVAAPAVVRRGVLRQHGPVPVQDAAAGDRRRVGQQARVDVRRRRHLVGVRTDQQAGRQRDVPYPLHVHKPEDADADQQIRRAAKATMRAARAHPVSLGRGRRRQRLRGQVQQQADGEEIRRPGTRLRRTRTAA